jgi:putative phosphoesterase
MKILVTGDTHGREMNLLRIIEKVSPIDMLVHLGDFEGGGEIIRKVAPCRLELVSGNNDFGTGIPKERLVSIGSYNVMLTHGHRYGVYSGTGLLLEAAKRNYADIIMFGHTHIPMIKKEEGIWLINPGSPVLPRQQGRIPTYIIMEIDGRGEAHFTLNQFRG